MALSARHDGPAASVRLPSVNAGPLVALVGLALTLYGLFQPFYVVRFPVAALRRMTAVIDDPFLQSLSQYAAANLARINAAGGARVSAWDAFEFVDVAVAGLVVLAAGIVLLRSLGHVSPAMARQTWSLGAGALALVAFRMLRAPVPSEAHPYVALGTGAWMVLAGACLVLVGTWLAAARR